MILSDKNKKELIKSFTIIIEQANEEELKAVGDALQVIKSRVKEEVLEKHKGEW